MRTPPKKVFVMMNFDRNGDCEFPVVAESEYDAANMADGCPNDEYGPVYVYERVAGPFKMEIKREAVVTPIIRKRKNK